MWRPNAINTNKVELLRLDLEAYCRGIALCYIVNAFEVEQLLLRSRYLLWRHRALDETIPEAILRLRRRQKKLTGLRGGIINRKHTSSESMVPILASRTEYVVRLPVRKVPSGKLDGEAASILMLNFVYVCPYLLKIRTAREE